MGVSLICVTSCAFSCHSFLPMEKHVWSSHAKDQQNHKWEEAEQFLELVQENFALFTKVLMTFFPQTSFQQYGFEWTGVLTNGGEKRRETHRPLYINTTTHLRSYVCHSVPIMCTHSAFARHCGACHILIRIGSHTNGLALLVFHCSIGGVDNIARCQAKSVVAALNRLTRTHLPDAEDVVPVSCVCIAHHFFFVVFFWCNTFRFSAVYATLMPCFSVWYNTCWFGEHLLVWFSVCQFDAVFFGLV